MLKINLAERAPNAADTVTIRFGGAFRLLPAQPAVDSGKIRFGGAFRLLSPAERQA